MNPVATSPRTAVRPSAKPSLRLERKCWRNGETLVCGIDEVGRGAWAGPVSVGAVIPPDKSLAGVRDSKMLTHVQREAAAKRIRRWAVGYAVGHASHLECDELGMTAALRLAATRALDDLAAQGLVPDRVILDGNHDYIGLGDRCTTVIKGDSSSLAVAAASVIAKVTRDALMADEAEHFPAYGFESNRGYPAPAHKYALRAHGPTSIHRRTWIFMDDLPWPGLPPAPGRLFRV